METIKNFSARVSLKMETREVFANPNMEDAENMRHFQVKISDTKSAKPASMILHYSIGSAIKKFELSDVLEALKADASSARESFDDWCGDVGYDTDSRRALRTYETIRKQATNLKRVLGAEEFRKLIEETID